MRGTVGMVQPEAPMHAGYSTRVSLLAATGLLAAWGPLTLGCAGYPGVRALAPLTIQVVGRSHNRSKVDVYLLCGDDDARWLGVIGWRETAAFEVPNERAHCLQGLNFFLVVRKSGRGYWAGPVRPRPGGYVELVVEKYAGLSAARVIRDWR